MVQDSAIFTVADQ